MTDNPINSFLDRVRTFAAARAALAALELNLFPQLAESARSREDVRRALALADGPITDCFFDLLVTAGFLEESENRLALSPMSRAILESHDSIQSWGREMLDTYRGLQDLEELLKSGAFEKTNLASFWAYKTTTDRSALDTEEVAEYSARMDSSQREMSQHIAEVYDFSAHRQVMDFGGGYGRLAITLVRRYPDLRVTIADLPAVCEGARERIEAEGLSDRVQYLPCDFLNDPLPEAVADLVLFCRVLHDWNEPDLSTLLRRTRRCLQPGGKALAVEPMFNEAEPLTESALPAAIMLSLLGGRRRSVQAYERLFKSAGYSDVSWRESGQSIWRLVIACV
jgi:ubiquinone/menaquinone biosynthesis C-methylase UbiE